MKKTICILGCVIALMLTGCQTQHDPSMDTDQIFPSGSSNVGVPSAGNPVNTDTGSDQTNGKDNPNTNTPSEDDSSNAPTQSAPISGDIRDISSIENDSPDAASAATLDKQDGERELKNEDSLRGEIEVTHKLPIGKTNLFEGDTVVFHIEAKSADADLKITLTGTGTGTILEGSVTGSGDISFEIDTADEYTAVLENCSLHEVKFTIDYSVGGSK